ncbi:hypothetical protein BTUL_0271g00070 [Botrytis tulipae]|uniref:Uncharacterized protein n=1 Tax=Botrytis tulipae TaxID=87230 RepID=A0A4Z1E5V5_9HELO|nr:hypothetical protein BTUL_0271g00070 [Botrytis tulipae]
MPAKGHNQKSELSIFFATLRRTGPSGRKIQKADATRETGQNTHELPLLCLLNPQVLSWMPKTKILFRQVADVERV